MTVLLAIDSFKGSLTSEEAEKAVSIGVRSVRPDCRIVCIPISDGGEGMLEAIKSAVGGQEISVACHDALMRPVTVRYLVLNYHQTAVIEMAQAAGLSLLSEAERDPLKTTTYGVGELILDALNRGLRHFIVGLGGSATNDGGTGMLTALGGRLFDEEGRELMGCGANLSRIHRIDLSALHPALSESSFTVACDVDSPFCGPRGATRVFARQKGADADAVEYLEQGMNHLSQVIERQTGVDLQHRPGAGAAGGLGGMLMALLGAKRVSGFDLLDEMGQIECRVSEADLVITGEGRADEQTLMGKVPLGMLKLARRHGVPVMLVAGQVDNVELMRSAGFELVVQTTPADMPLDEAMKPTVAMEHITRAVAECLKAYSS